jgi:hypothetical protein
MKDILDFLNEIATKNYVSIEQATQLYNKYILYKSSLPSSSLQNYTSSSVRSLHFTSNEITPSAPVRDRINFYKPNLIIKGVFPINGFEYITEDHVLVWKTTLSGWWTIKFETTVYVNQGVADDGSKFTILVDNDQHQSTTISNVKTGDEFTLRVEYLAFLNKGQIVYPIYSTHNRKITFTVKSAELTFTKFE